MKDILDEIIAQKRVEVYQANQEMPLEVLKDLTWRKIEQDGAAFTEGGVVKARKLRSMRKSLERSMSGIISEFKRKSPSKGWIHEDADPTVVIPQYAKAGASALSILTDKQFFGGDLEFIRAVRPLVPDTPILRKDFIIDEYQLFEARLMGADAVLLIAADLEVGSVFELTEKAHELGLEVLLEIHSPEELCYVKAVPQVDMLGVNNRALGTFHTDVQHSFDIAAQMRDAIVGLSQKPLLVSESGISSPQIVKQLREVGFRGFLIGENFMKTSDPGATLREFIKETEEC